MRPDQHVSSSGTWCRETSHDAQSRLHGGLYQYGGALQHDPVSSQDPGPAPAPNDSTPAAEAARSLWGKGNYALIGDLIHAQGDRLVEWSGLGPQDRVLDVGAGAGAASLPAAATGARVTATDITSELLEIGKQRALERGLDIEWQTADAAALPFADASYDVVMSAIGAMFAPDQQATADELVRVCRPGGTIAMANWTADGGAGRFFGALAPYVTPPPPGPGPTAWGDPDHVAALFGDRVSDLHMEPDVVQVDFAGSADELRCALPGILPARRRDPGRPGRPRAAGGIGPRPERVLPQGVRRGRCPVRLPARPGDRRLTQARDHSCRRQVWPTRSWPNEWCALESTSSKPAAS